MKLTRALKSTAYHEAGHAVAAWHLGVRTKALSIVPEARSAGRHTHHSYFGGINLDWGDSPRAQRKAENMALVCCAGPAAQRRFDPKGFRNYHAKDDWHQAVDLLSHLTGDDEILSAHFKLIDLRARKFVARPQVWPLIEGLAGALLEQQHLNGKDVHAVINESMSAAVQAG